MKRKLGVFGVILVVISASLVLLKVMPNAPFVPVRFNRWAKDQVKHLMQVSFIWHSHRLRLEDF